MFQVNDRVRKRFCFGGTSKRFNPEGTVVGINGRWIHVLHDKPVYPQGMVAAQPDRFDYLAEELEHINPLLRIAFEN